MCRRSEHVLLTILHIIYTLHRECKKCMWDCKFRPGCLGRCARMSTTLSQMRSSHPMSMCGSMNNFLLKGDAMFGAGQISKCIPECITMKRWNVRVDDVFISNQDCPYWRMENDLVQTIAVGSTTFTGTRSKRKTKERTACKRSFSNTT